MRSWSHFVGGSLPASGPVTDRDSPPERTVTNAREPDDLIRVLVVDDDPRVRQAIGNTVTLEPDMVMAGAAPGAESALAVAAGSGPLVVLIDVLLPDADSGLALVRALSRQPGCAVVAMSVRSGLDRASRAAGAVSFVEKAGDIDALLHAVRAAAESPLL